MALSNTLIRVARCWQVKLQKRELHNNLVSSKVSTLSPARERELRKATDKFERQLSKIEVQIGIVHDQNA